MGQNMSKAGRSLILPAVLRVGVLGEYSWLRFPGTLELSTLLVNDNGITALGNLKILANQRRLLWSSLDQLEASPHQSSMTMAKHLGLN